MASILELIGTFHFFLINFPVYIFDPLLFLVTSCHVVALQLCNERISEVHIEHFKIERVQSQFGFWLNLLYHEPGNCHATKRKS